MSVKKKADTNLVQNDQKYKTVDRQRNFKNIDILTGHEMFLKCKDLVFCTKKRKLEGKLVFVVEISLVLWYDTSTTIGTSMSIWTNLEYFRRKKT